jgi:hypothetical protein
MRIIFSTPFRVAGCLLASALAASLVAAQAAEAASEAVRVPCWEPHEFIFGSEARLENPFQVAFAAEATGPGGSRLNLPGFFDGNGTWKVRFAPTVEGEWSLQTHSEVAALNNRHATLVCISNLASNFHGGLHVDSVVIGRVHALAGGGTKSGWQAANRRVGQDLDASV